MMPERLGTDARELRVKLMSEGRGMDALIVAELIEEVENSLRFTPRDQQKATKKGQGKKRER